MRSAPQATAASALRRRIIAQPMRSSGSRPCTERSNERGTSGTRSGKRSLIAGGGVPAVSVAVHSTIAPFSAHGLALSQGERAGDTVEIEARPVGRGDATSPAVRASPITIASGLPVRRRNVSVKNCPIAFAGLLTSRSTAAVQGNVTVAATITAGGTTQQAEPDQRADALAIEPDHVAGHDDHGETGEHHDGSAPPTGAGAAEQHREQRRDEGRREREEIDEAPGEGVDRQALDRGRERAAAGKSRRRRKPAPPARHG